MRTGCYHFATELGSTTGYWPTRPRRSKRGSSNNPGHLDTEQNGVAWYQANSKTGVRRFEPIFSRKTGPEIGKSDRTIFETKTEVRMLEGVSRSAGGATFGFRGRHGVLRRNHRCDARCRVSRAAASDVAALDKSRRDLAERDRPLVGIRPVQSPGQLDHLGIAFGV